MNVYLYRSNETQSLTDNMFLYRLQRMDLGECPKIHDLALRADYENASKSKDYFYDIDVSYYAACVSDVR